MALKMILYQLKCATGHEFEAWFKDGAAYDKQISDKDISCPYCSSAKISKAIMAPNISPSRTKSVVPRADQETKVRVDDIAEKILDAVEALRQDVETNCDNVGDQFAEEARRIYYGEAEERGIYGEADAQDASDLEEEGITFFRLPPRPRRNS